jgi:tRNA/tmRNA/rRNA uracil-C5-methylase (TrmA/RlmC/RlmD family)
VIPCPHRPPCTACPRYGEIGIAAPARLKLEALATANGLIEVPVITGPALGFRTRARLAIRGRAGAPKLGLFEEGTHRLVTVPECRVHDPLINEVAAIVRRALADARVPPYSDIARLGLARYLQIVVERESRRAQVVLVANSPTSAPLAEALALIRERLGPRLHSLWFNAQTEPTNVIQGPTFEHIAGDDALVEHYGSPIDICHPPGAFGQSNPAVATSIIEHLRGAITPGSRVAEFYGGVGAIGLSLLPNLAELRINELATASLAGLQMGLARLDRVDPTLRPRVCVFPGAAGEALEAAAWADVVIADPPRKGLDPALLANLAHTPPSQVWYIACGLDAFLADAERLLGGGRLRLAGLTAFDLMPFTGHVETVARFESS